MTVNDIKRLAAFIDDHIEHLGCNGCNDYSIPATNENIDLAIQAERSGQIDTGIAHHVYIEDGQICTTDFVILLELKRRLLALIH